jgi:lysyl-tRNA synthetase, class II
MPEAARVVALALGLALIWISRSLARRRRRAWQLAVGIVIASATAHLAKGLDFEEALTSLVLLAALWRWRLAFDAPGDRTGLRPLRRLLLALAALGMILALRASAHMALSDLIEDALALLAGGLTIWALYLWLRPVVEQVHQSVRERALAERLVLEHGGDGLAYFALRHDKSYFFAPSGRSFLAYRVVSGCALVSGDPIGERSEIKELLSEFRRVAQSRGWRVAILGASSERIDTYRSLGFRSVYLGDECIVHPAAFSLEGRPIRKVRQSVHRLEKAGYRVRLLAVGDADEHLKSELRRVSIEWRGHSPERGFTMAMDGLFAYPDTVLAVAEAPDGRIGGFIQLVPAAASGAYSLTTMRRSRETPNGLMEYLVVQTIFWARDRGVREISLNFSVFARLLRSGSSSPLRRRALRLALLRLDRLFQLERLHMFNRKFLPEWRPRYVCVEHLSDFPVVGLAYLRAESLLTPPGPWIRTHDLASR